MKRIKSVLPYLTVLVLVATLMLGYFGGFIRAHADADPGVVTQASFFEGKVVTKAKLGGTFDIPSGGDVDTITVTAPDGTVDETPADTISATQVGNYTVTYTKDESSYSYNVLCYEEVEYFVNVMQTKDNFIPGYRRSTLSTKGKAEDSVINIPEFALAYTNSKEEIKNLDADEYTAFLDFNGTLAEMDTAAGTYANGIPKKLINLKNGVLTLTFKAKLNTGDAVIDNDPTRGKWYSQQYTVNIQHNFEDTISPSLSTVSISTTANINTLVTLPIASASDNYDNNVFVEVKVTKADASGTPQPVLKYEANKYGYAKTANPGDPVEFDNKNVRSFYAVEEGIYVATYTAYDGSGNVSSTPHTYKIECRDKLAPVIWDIADEQIPTKWGFTVKWGQSKDSPDNTAVERSNKFTLPFPAVIDNVSAEDDMNLIVYIQTPGNTTVARWEDSVSAYKSAAGATLTNTNYIPKDSTLNFKANAMEFSFDVFDWANNTTLKRSGEKLGDWKITYSLKDEAGNGGSGSAQKVYTINVSDVFTDRNKPTISKAEMDLPEYVLINENENTDFTVPVVAATDDNATSSLRVNYTAITNAAAVSNPPSVFIEDTEYQVVYTYKFDGGETLPIRSCEDITGKDLYYLLISDREGDFAMPLRASNEILVPNEVLAPQLTFSYSVSDDVGNTATIDDFNIDFIYSGSLTQTLTLITDGTFDPTLPIAGQDPEANPGSFSPVLTPGSTDEDGEKIVTGNKKYLGGFVITGVEKRAYTGYEFEILDPNGDSVSASSYAYSREIPKEDPDDEDETQFYAIYVRDITFIPEIKGTYRFNIRTYDISGMSICQGYSFEIGQGEDYNLIIKGNAARISASGEIRNEYALKSEYQITRPEKNAEYVIVRRVEGNAYGLVGNKFTALITGSYDIEDYTWKYDSAYDVSDDEMKDAVGMDSRQTYTVVIEDKSSPMIEFRDYMPTYFEETQAVEEKGVYAEPASESEQKFYIELPLVTAYTPYSNAEILMEMTFNGGVIDMYKLYIDAEGKKTFDKEDKEGVENKAIGTWAFAAPDSGTYSLRITATPKTGVQNSITKELKIGKVTLPVFDVDYPSATAKVGDTFNRGKVNIDTSEEWETLSVRLKNPKGNDVSEVSLSLDVSGYNKIKDSIDDWKTDYEFADAGYYDIVYKLTDSAGNETTQSFRINVTADGSKAPANLTPLMITLVVIGVLLIVGVIIYIIRFRTVKNTKGTTAKK